MADLSRDEHIARAEELLAKADHLIDHLDDLVYGDKRPFGTRKADEETAARFADVAGVHLKFADVLGQQPAGGPSAWKWDHSSLLHSSGDWEIEYIHGCELDERRPRAGWYLYGNAPKHTGPVWVGSSPDEAMESADKGIAGVVELLPRTWSWSGTEYDLGKKYRSTRGDFTFEFVGTLTDGMPLMRQYPAGVRALINPAATVFRMFGPLVPVDEDEVPF